MIFVLQRCAKTDRIVLAAVHLAWCSPDLHEEVAALCWLEAKEKFGYPLTTIQERMLVEKKEQQNELRKTA